MKTGTEEKDHHPEDNTALTKNEALLRNTIDSSLDMIQVFQAVRNERNEIVDFVWILNNKTSEKVYGNVIGKSLLTLNPGVVKEGIFDTFKKVTETGEPDQSERHYVHEQFNGWFLQSTVKQGDGVATTTSDITTAKQAEHKIRNSQAFLQTVIDSSLDIIQVFIAVRDATGTIIDFLWKVQNQRGFLQNGDLIGESLLLYNPGVIPSGIFDRMVSVTDTGIPSEQEQYYSTEQFSGQWFYQALVKHDDGVLMTTRDITAQKMAEIEVLQLKDEIAQRAQDKYYSIFNSIGEGFCIFEMLYNEDGKPVDYRFVEVNPTFERQTGLKHVVGKTGSQLPFGTEPAWLEQYNNVIKNEEAVHFESFQESTMRWYHVYASKVGNGNSRIVAAVFDDITERKHAEIALRESEAHNRAIIDQTSVGIIHADLSGAITFLNDKARKLFGFTSGEGIGVNVLDITVSEFREATLQKFQRLIHEGHSFESEKKMIRKNEREFWANVSVAGIRDELNKTKSIVAVVIDITNRKEAEEALRKSEELLSIVLKVSPVGIGFVNKNGRFLLLNDEMKRFMPSGIMPSMDDDRYGRWKFYDNDGKRVQRQNYPGIRALRGENIEPIVEMRYIDDNGGEIWTRVASIALKDQKGEVFGAVSVVTDIDELKKTTEALLESERQLKLLLKQRDEFIGVASHELKTPVTSMKTYAEIVQERLDEKGDVENSELLSRLNTQINRLTTLIGHLLDTTRISEGQLKLSLEEIDLNERVEEIQTTTPHHFIVQSGILPSVIADRERIGQVITNLLSNAIKYSPIETTITISTYPQLDGIRVDVRDEGYGIPEKDIGKVFQRFYRVTSNNMETFPGMGLGLYITAQIIQKHGGTVSVQSTEGKGSIFSFTIPYKIPQQENW